MEEWIQLKNSICSHQSFKMKTSISSPQYSAFVMSAKWILEMQEGQRRIERSILTVPTRVLNVVTFTRPKIFTNAITASTTLKNSRGQTKNKRFLSLWRTNSDCVEVLTLLGFWFKNFGTYLDLKMKYAVSNIYNLPPLAFAVSKEEVFESKNMISNIDVPLPSESSLAFAALPAGFCSDYRRAFDATLEHPEPFESSDSPFLQLRSFSRNSGAAVGLTPLQQEPYVSSQTAIVHQLTVQKAKDGGLNVVETYVFRNAHEPTPGNHYFDGRYNLVQFIKTLQKAGLCALCPRICLYVCHQRNFGGFPFWLKYVPGISFGRDNEPFKGENLFESQGEPIILYQIENEYKPAGKAAGAAGHAYMTWAAKMALDMDTGGHTGRGYWSCKEEDPPDPVELTSSIHSVEHHMVHPVYSCIFDNSSFTTS